MTSQSSVNFPETSLKTAQNSAKHYKKQVMRAVFALLTSVNASPVLGLVAFMYVARIAGVATYGM